MTAEPRITQRGSAATEVLTADDADGADRTEDHTGAKFQRKSCV
jgi:hypothetical protein